MTGHPHAKPLNAVKRSAHVPFGRHGKGSATAACALKLHRKMGTRISTKYLSGTSDTSHLSEPSQASGCPCGRSHQDHIIVGRKVEKPVFNHRAAGEAAAKASEANKLLLVYGRTILQFAGNCERPIEIDGIARKFSTEGRRLTYQVRCRKCSLCLQAKMRYWAAAGYHQTRSALDAGKRTWFGTLTFSAEWQARLANAAQEKWMIENSNSSEIPTWWEDQLCDHRFSLVRKEVVHELQKYWKRLRKAGHKYKYLVAIERHKSGNPHIHWLLHEVDAPIRKRHLQAAWPHGFTKIVIVGGKSRNSANAAKAAHYVVKYLSKSAQARQIASKGYRPNKQANTHHRA